MRSESLLESQQLIKISSCLWWFPGNWVSKLWKVFEQLKRNTGSVHGWMHFTKFHTPKGDSNKLNVIRYFESLWKTWCRYIWQLVWVSFWSVKLREIKMHLTLKRHCVFFQLFKHFSYIYWHNCISNFANSNKTSACKLVFLLLKVKI